MSRTPQTDAAVAEFLKRLGPAAKTIDQLAAEMNVDRRTVQRRLTVVRALKAQGKCPQFEETPGGKNPMATFRLNDSGAPNGIFGELKQIQSLLAESPVAASAIDALVRRYEGARGQERQTQENKALQLSRNYRIDGGPQAEDLTALNAKIDKIGSMIDANAKMRFVYKKEHEMFPLRMVQRIGCLYLICANTEELDENGEPKLWYCRVSRIRMIKGAVEAEFPGGPKALERMRKRADRYFDEYWGQDHAFGDEEGERAEGIELELNGYMAAFVRDWALVKSGRATLTEGKDGKAVLKIGRLAPTNEFVSWLAGHVPEVVVLGPESLRRKVAEKIKLGNGIYSGSAGKGAARPRS